MATREMLLAWGIRKTEKLSLAEGLELVVRQLNAGELQQAKKVARDLSAGNDDAYVMNLCAAIICRSAINPDDGSRIFADEDMSTLIDDFSYAAMDQLVDPVFRVNGILVGQQEETKKNSETTPVSSSAIN